MEARVGRAHSRGELGILGKRPLDLLEQPLLVFRERHGTPPGHQGRSRVDRQTVTARWLLTGKSTSGYACRKAGRRSGVVIFLGRRLRALVPGPLGPRPGAR